MNLTQTEWLVLGAVALALAWYRWDAIKGWIVAKAPIVGDSSDPLDAFMAVIARDAEKQRLDQVKSEIVNAARERLAPVPKASSIEAVSAPATVPK